MRRNGLLLMIVVLLMVAVTLLAWKPWVVQAEQPVSALSAAWAASGHGDYTSESFNHWNEEEEPVVPVACAKCHSGFGMRDYLGLDGSAAGAVDAPARLGSVVSCETCHNPAADSLASVSFPSGETVEVTDGSALCMTCHAGMGSGEGVKKAAAGAGVADDTVSPDLKSMNPHYFAAGATQLGALAKGGYEYEGKTYAGRFEHSANAQTCTDCHDAHTLTVDAENCQSCHSNVVDAGDFVDVRESDQDLDGDGDLNEGMAAEIEGLRQQLIAGIQLYASQELQAPLLFVPEAYPYFFNDTNANGAADEGEAIYPNQYATWSPRLVRTTFNLLFVTKDPGSYVHNPAYAAQLMYDSLEDLSQVVTLDLSALARP